MRKLNSVFKTAFVSEGGAELKNKDYFAYIELDEFACYVLASEITDFEASDAAKEAVEHLILSFQERPGMKKSSLLRYMKETNERLLVSGVNHRLKASVIMVVTDYEKFRYVAAGNVRLRMYRQGRFLLKSQDMSLANDLFERGETETPIDRHEERHNLYAYLGKKDFFKPFVSKVEKLADADIISLYSQGLWENVDDQEIDEIFAEASDDPQESIDTLEEVLLSRQPPNLSSYTIVAIFIDKTFKDPERERKRLFYIKVAVISIIVILILTLIGYLIYSWRQNKIANFEKAMQETVQYMNADNYTRAQESCKTALDMAKDLGRTEDEKTLNNYLLLFDNLIEAENFFDNKEYHSAYDSYMRAVEYTAGTDKSVYSYIRQRLESIGRHLDSEEFLDLGDNLFNNGNYDAAEGMYLKSRDKAAAAHNSEGRDKAVAALEKLYNKEADIRKEAEQKIADKKKVALSDALKKGDDLLAAGDLEGAQAAYLDARNMTDDPADRTVTSAALEKVAEAKDKKELEEKSSAEALEKQFDKAKELEEKGSKAFDDKDYLTAQLYYSQAMDAYNALNEFEKAKAAKEKAGTATTIYVDTLGKKIEAEDTEQIARNFYADKNYTEAKAAAEKAKQLYTDAGMKNKADEMELMIEQITTDEAIDNALK